jgi:hypothetical protein
MRIDSRLIGFTARRVRVPLSKPTHATCSIRRSLAPIKERAHPSVRNSSSVRRCSCYCLAAHCEWAQYLITLQPILHVTRAHLLQFPDSAACRFRKAPRLKAPNRLVCAFR